MGMNIGLPLPAIIPKKIKGTLIDVAKLLIAYFQIYLHISNMINKTILC